MVPTKHVRHQQPYIQPYILAVSAGMPLQSKSGIQAEQTTRMTNLYGGPFSEPSSLSRTKQFHVKKNFKSSTNIFKMSHKDNMATKTGARIFDNLAEMTSVWQNSISYACNTDG